MKRKHPTIRKFIPPAGWRDSPLLPDSFEAIEAGRPVPPRVNVDTREQLPLDSAPLQTAAGMSAAAA
jgi:hypothetical protein